MYLLNGTDALVTSASDLTLASDCEFALLRVLDHKLGWSDDPIPPDDAMLDRAAELGNVHELRLLERLRAEHGDAVVELDRPGKGPEGLRASAALTRDALQSGAPVVYQAVFFDETDPLLPFVGFADFLTLQPDGRYRVVDTKLSRKVRVTALLQLAAYHEQLERLGVPVDDIVELVLGDDRVEQANIRDIRPVFRRRRDRLHAVIAEHRSEGRPVAWGDDRYAIDGRCKWCDEPARAADDLIGVAGMRLTQRAKLRAAGIRTLADLAATPARPDDCGIPASTYAKLHRQAALQAKAAANDDGSGIPPIEIVDARPIAALPEPSPGDLFFDFEGDPMYAEPQPGGAQRWGLDYLFGWCDANGEFDMLWAHTHDQEARALERFLEFVATRRREYPDLHVYHYASYEKTHLLSIAARHGAGEREVDQLLRDGVLVDLYPIVMASVRVGAPSYSIKKLEPLYMGDAEREGTANAADSVVQYNEFRAKVDEGDEDGAEALLNDIAQYNAYDCRSTLALRDWLRSLPGVADAAEAADWQLGEDLARDAGPVFEESRLDAALEELAQSADDAAEQASGPSRDTAEAAARAADASASAAAYRLAGAAVDYHRREKKSFWWEHFARLEQPADEWQDGRGIFAIDECVEDGGWGEPGPRGGARKRRLALDGEWGPGSSAPRSGDVHLLYEAPAPFRKPGRNPAHRLDVPARIVDVLDDGTLVVEERLPPLAEPWTDKPTHIAPGRPIPSDNIEAAIAEWGRAVLDAAPEWPDDPMSRLLLRRAPGDDGELEPLQGPDDTVRAVVASLTARGARCLAVQGPPGTGKTYLASHVIRRLVQEHGWAVGVTAQSHKVVENVLEALVGDAGLEPGLVGKKPSTKDDGAGTEPGYTALSDGAFARFADERGDSGYVIGGTAWDMTNRNRVGARQLDLLVIDEAGQFSLANTIAVAMSARRVLLLGDPQQLPQVTQGTHPAPVDGSALGHLIGGHAILPAELGYFLAESRRMDPALADAVSELAYDGQLRSHPTTEGRDLAGLAPGVHSVEVVHHGNANSSPEEADAVVQLVREHLGRAWRSSPVAEARPIGQSDLIIVTPYNAQLELVRERLDAAGFAGVPVGTVDKFQGREAVLAIVSLSASDAVEVPRGVEFVLDRNRLNVAISRAKWAAFVVHSPALADHLPRTAEGLATLSRFIGLVDGAHTTAAERHVR